MNKNQFQGLCKSLGLTNLDQRWVWYQNALASIEEAKAAEGLNPVRSEASEQIALDAEAAYHAAHNAWQAATKAAQPSEDQTDYEQVASVLSSAYSLVKAAALAEVARLRASQARVVADTDAACAAIERVAGLDAKVRVDQSDAFALATKPTATFGTAFTPSF